MSKKIDIVLLTALPASGKSEVRRFLEFQKPETCREVFHMGPTVQLDDFPYVHMMRRIDDELEAVGSKRLFFSSGRLPFMDARDWGTLIELINEDYDDLVNKRVIETPSAADLLYTRMDKAAAKAGFAPRYATVSEEVKKQILPKLEPEARDMLTKKHADYTDLADKTVVIEFARGGKDGTTPPLKDPLGYQYSFRMLSPEILEKAAVLYIWVTPEESRRKNAARTNPDDPGSILHHGVPIEVLLNDYGVCDMPYLEEHSEKPGYITIEKDGKKYYLPFGKFDNRVDKTSFLREDVEKWDKAAVADITGAIKSAMDAAAGR